MGNTITKNGTLSSTITGLLVSELPDITRPPRRQEITQVDGRDGDLVRYQGYDTYKKTVQIGLHGAFDVDAVINYLGGEAWWVFSNEPTKKYYGRIADGYDLTRLVRFRTGKVSIIVQPYKKLVSESNVSGATSPLSVVNQGYENSLPKITIAGTAGNVIGLKVNGITIMSITIPPEGTITIDGEARNCYNSNADKNQYVTMAGDFPTLPSGTNAISWTGTATGVTVVPNSRWL